MHAPVLQLQGIAHGSRHEVTEKVRSALDEGHAWVTDVHFFSGILTVFNFEVNAGDLAALCTALEAAGLRLEPTPAHAVGPKDALVGTLAVTFADGDPSLTHVVPAVPG